MNPQIKNLRVFAYIIDAVIWSLMVLPINYIYRFLYDTFYFEEGWLMYIPIIALIAMLIGVWLLYNVYCESKFGFTLGKKLLGIRVVNKYSKHLIFRESLERNLLKLFVLLFGFIGLGLLYFLAHNDNQTAIDEKVGAYVVKNAQKLDTSIQFQADQPEASNYNQQYTSKDFFS